MNEQQEYPIVVSLKLARDNPITKFLENIARQNKFSVQEAVEMTLQQALENYNTKPTKLLIWPDMLNFPQKNTPLNTKFDTRSIAIFLLCVLAAIVAIYLILNVVR
jgi:hypothetical protein